MLLLSLARRLCSQWLLCTTTAPPRPRLPRLASRLYELRETAERSNTLYFPTLPRWLVRDRYVVAGTIAPAHSLSLSLSLSLSPPRSLTHSPIGTGHVLCVSARFLRRRDRLGADATNETRDHYVPRHRDQHLQDFARVQRTLPSTPISQLRLRLAISATDVVANQCRPTCTRTARTLSRPRFKRSAAAPRNSRRCRRRACTAS